MFLNIFIAIKDFFSELFNKITIGNLDVLIFGIIIGFLICLIFYLFLVMNSLQTDKKKLRAHQPTIDDESVQKLVLSAKNEFSEEYSSETVKVKAEALKNICWQLISDIAKLYYPESDYPIYELSLEELLVLNHYITDRISSLFKGTVLKSIKKIRISVILKIIDIKKDIDSKKAIKIANQLHMPGIIKAVTGVLNVFNPLYWVKKLMIGTTMTAAANKISQTIIDIVGEETNKVYSKSVFNVEKENSSQVEQAIYEIETMMDKE